MRKKEIWSCGSLRTWAAIAAVALFLVTRVAVAQASATTVQADKPRYLRGEVVTISGTVSPAQSIAVGVEVRNPNGQPKFIKQVTSASDGSWSTGFTLPSNALTGTWTVYATPSGGTQATTTFLVQVLVTGTTTTTILETVSGTTTVVQTTSGAVTVSTVVTRRSATTITSATTSTSFLRSYTTSTATVAEGESTATALVEVTEISAGTSVTVTHMVIILGQTETYILKTLTATSTNVRTTTSLVPGATETHQRTIFQTVYVAETTGTVDYLLVALAFATPALFFAWALIFVRRRP